jgi:hypothetical protein
MANSHVIHGLVNKRALLQAELTIGRSGGDRCTDDAQVGSNAARLHDVARQTGTMKHPAAR